MINKVKYYKCEIGFIIMIMIFDCSNKSKTCDWATLFLNENGIEAVNLHGDMPYDLRLGKFKKYQDGLVNIMVSTDVGSRGLNTIRVIYFKP